MKNNQKFSPKYWVAHDKTTDEVFLDTAHKGCRGAMDNFLDLHTYERWGVQPDDKLEDLWFEDEDLEVILIEILKVAG